ncbi:hypothetical protein PFISCL1PPCAC_8258 [Pristionchus fissidentatus]|uniref:Uncharacterized protein n=1 Tax=Pristionchus fissidentatus TaxID=1538716 RepID=A0AAV5VC44_9BILA|nr:hypothetical protein PFISCL1PPCAC_8258 [Pristionchus fissidentatus]
MAKVEEDRRRFFFDDAAIDRNGGPYTEVEMRFALRYISPTAIIRCEEEGNITEMPLSDWRRMNKSINSPFTVTSHLSKPLLEETPEMLERIAPLEERLAAETRALHEYQFEAYRDGDDQLRREMDELMAQWRIEDREEEWAEKQRAAVRDQRRAEMVAEVEKIEKKKRQDERLKKVQAELDAKKKRIEGAQQLQQQEDYGRAATTSYAATAACKWFAFLK